MKIYSGEEAFEESIKLISPSKLKYTPLSNRYFFGKKLLSQNVPYLNFIFSQVLVLDLNPRLLHVWIITLVRRFLFKKTILWGHAWPRGGKFSKTDKFRGLLRRLGGTVIVYTNSQKNELDSLGSGVKVYAAPNALYSSEEMGFLKDSVRTSIIYVGRLVNSKKPYILIEAFCKFCQMNPLNSVFLDLVGDGDQKVFLTDYVNSLDDNVKSRIRFHGHISDKNHLKDLYDRSFVSVSPGYVGLSITQSFSFGVPMIISRDEPHSPEIEAAIEGENCSFFSTDDSDSLVENLNKYFAAIDKFDDNASKIVQHCRNNYSTEIMAESIAIALRDCN